MAKPNGIPNENLINIIGAETTITGDIVTKGDIRLDGKLEGNLRVEGKVIIGETGQIQGTVSCRNLEVLGKINGKIEVRELSVLKTTAILQADMITKKLGVEPGAVFTGHCQMSEKANHEQKTTVTKAEVATE